MNTTRKDVKFYSGSQNAIQGFPADSRREAGQQLARLQQGLSPIESRPVKVIGPGVQEIQIQNRGKSHVIYLVSARDAVHVLHAFEKKTSSTEADIKIALGSMKQVLTEDLDTKGRL